MGLLAGVVLLASGLILQRREDLPYLSEGLAGGGLGILYLSLYAAYALYHFVGVVSAFAAMFAVTVAGSAVAVATSRQITAVLTLIGGLLTPGLLAPERPNERGLVSYLLIPRPASCCSRRSSCCSWRCRWCVSGPSAGAGWRSIWRSSSRTRPATSGPCTSRWSAGGRPPRRPTPWLWRGCTRSSRPCTVSAARTTIRPATSIWAWRSSS